MLPTHRRVTIQPTAENIDIIFLDIIRHGSHHLDVTQWFLNCGFKASRLAFRHHCVELEVTIIGKAADTMMSERKGLDLVFHQRSWFLNGSL